MLVAVDVDGTIDAYPRELQSMMAALRAAGHQVYVVTGITAEQPSDEDVQTKADYLASLGLADCYDELCVIASPNGDVSDRKAQYLVAVRADLLIDNTVANAKAVTAQGILTLVPWGSKQKNNLEASKSDATADVASCRVVKASEERRYTLGVAYPANKPDRSVAADGHRDFVSPEVLEKTAWAWMANHRDITLHHTPGTSGHATVVESYIYRGPDWEVPSPVDGNPYIVKSGDWLLGSVWDEYGWAAVKSGLVNGWSPEGGCARATPTPERLAQLRS